ncbi:MULTISPECIES: GreA/GreB family elongation factor [Pseudomonas]|uniref:GreA/GreB family elongation factor n=1 Tax=Pseudomonas TaxID=286 RepID=UPI0020981C3F|nr:MULTISPECIES: GreA/GreB family elongation factor [Pseudomonas chlororaphis group]MCO7578446.1 GreA/GreB family elongation factor [Pseudomonas protegens]MCO7584417.1 GreA/GreB family elongation factor [Pseudomonas chlororaphis]MCO7601532.1 GreA/GreB family elongation factor [Pseudomonas chlororaphis]
MSRAFVNEDLAAAQVEQPVERQISTLPNYVTPLGFAELQAKVAELHSQHSAQTDLGDAADQQQVAELERDLRYFSSRLHSAQVVNASTCDKVQIGSRVTFADEQDQQQCVQLVGEDQADAARGLINWASPLGRALMGAQPGDEVLWQRPAGDQLIEIIRIELA